MIIVVSFALFQKCRNQVSVVFIFFIIPFFYLRIFCSYKFGCLQIQPVTRWIFLELIISKNVDFGRAVAIQDFVLNFSLHLLTFNCFFHFFSSFWSNLTNIFPALRDHNENKAFLLVLRYPAICSLLTCKFSS